MSNDVNDKLNDLIGKFGLEAMVDLFSAYSVGAALVEKVTPADDPIVGVIGFTASKLRGNLALLLPSEVVKVTQSGSDPMDWAGELTNQYLGRLKNKLIAYGPALEISTPLVVSGLSLRLQEPAGVQTQRVDCSTTAGPVHALISVRTSEGFELLDEPVADTVAAEGEMLLF